MADVATAAMVAEFIGSHRSERNVRIVCQNGAQVSAHSAVLALNSSLLRELLGGGELARGTGEELIGEEEMEEGFVLLLPQFSSGLVSDALTFLYTGQVTLCQGQVQQFEVCLSQILGKDDFIDQLEGAGSITVTVVKEGGEGGSWPGFGIEGSSERGKVIHVDGETEAVERNGELAQEESFIKTKQKYVNGMNLDQIKTTGQEKPKVKELLKNIKEEHNPCSTTKTKPEYMSRKLESEASLHISKCLDSFEKYQSKFNKEPNLFELLDSVAGNPIKEVDFFQDCDLQEANESNANDCTDHNQKLAINYIKNEEIQDTKISLGQNADNKCYETRLKEEFDALKPEIFLNKVSSSTNQYAEKTKRNLEKNEEHKLKVSKENKETGSENIVFKENIKEKRKNTIEAFKSLETLKEESKENKDTDLKYFIKKNRYPRLRTKRGK